MSLLLSILFLLSFNNCLDIFTFNLRSFEEYRLHNNGCCTAISRPCLNNSILLCASVVSVSSVNVNVNDDDADDESFSSESSCLSIILPKK